MIKKNKLNRDKCKKYDISVADLAKMYGYNNEISFRNSSAYIRHIKATEQLIILIEERIIYGIKK